MAKFLLKDTHHFGINVPYELMETGLPGNKSLIIYLHGYKQNLIGFKKKILPLLDIEAYHLFLQGPYIIYDEKPVRAASEWGRAWYLYDGNQDRFKRSLEKSACYIQEIIDEVCIKISSSKTILMGYSMGGYQAGYFALSRPHYIDELIVVGGRIKTEYFSQNIYSGLKALILHGVNDRVVDIQSVEKSAEDLKKLGASVSFYKLNETHRLSQPYINKVKKWFEGFYS